MKLLVLVHAHPELQAGGTEIFARDLFLAMRTDGVDGMLVAGTAAHQRQSNPGTPFQSAGSRADEALLWTGGFDPFFFAQVDLHGVGPALADLLREQRPEIVHIHHMMVLGTEVVGLVRRVLPDARIVITLHDYYPICANDGQMVTTDGALCRAAGLDACRRCFPDRSTTDHKLRRLHMERALRLADRIVAPSRFLRDRYIEWGFPPDRIEIIPNGLPARSPAPARQSARRDQFAFFGHINRFKGATVALEASALLSGAGIEHRLTLHGGSDHQTEQTLGRFRAALEHAPAASYEGRYERDSLPDLIAGADWVVFPSQWWENAPLVINEAFQHWRPVIASDIGGAAELVEHGCNGLLFPVGNAARLAAAMRSAIETPGLWQRLVDGIEAPVTIARSAAEHLALYRRLLAAAPLREAA